MDAIDKKILQILSEEGRVTQAELSERVGLSLSTCQRRLKALEDRRAITGYRAQIDPHFLDEGLTVLVGVNLERHARSEIRRFQDAIIRLPKVKEVHHVAGEYDYILKVAVRDMDAYELFHADEISAIKGIAKITSFIAMSTLKS